MVAVYPPTPTSAALCDGVPAPVSVTFNVPLRVPVAVGLNCTVTTQFSPPPRVLPQVLLEILKSPGFRPAMLKPVNVTVPVPRLVTVIFLPALVVPTVTVPKFVDVGVSEIETPVPVNGTFWGLLLASSVKVRFPVLDPGAVGENVTVTVQLALASTVEPQVLVLIWKSPLVVMLLIFSVPVPVFVRVTILPLVVLPITVAPNFNDVGDRLTIGVPPPPPQPGNLKLAMRVFQLKLPVVFIYSCVYQNVQSSTGSTVMAL